jgi:hypothetical protein
MPWLRADPHTRAHRCAFSGTADSCANQYGAAAYADLAAHFYAAAADQYTDSGNGNRYANQHNSACDGSPDDSGDGNGYRNAYRLGNRL